MISFKGFGRAAIATVFATSLMAGSAFGEETITPDHIKAAKVALKALGATVPFDNILPTIAEQLKVSLIQSSPNYLDIINATVDAKALKLAKRRADLEKEAANIFAKTFTLEELQQISAFYASPAGKKLLSDGPIATRRLGEAADIWARGIGRDLEKESDVEMQKLISAAKKTEVPAPQ